MPIKAASSAQIWRSLGINLKQLYGQTEASVFITQQPDGQVRADTVGVPSPGVEVRIADTGEVFYRSDIRRFGRTALHGFVKSSDGLLYGMLDGRELDEVVRLGWAHGALSTTFPGDVTMARLPEVEAFAKGGSARVQR